MSCATCDGTGWKIVESGGLSGAAPCDCQLPARVESMTAHADIPKNYGGCTLENFKLDWLDPVCFVGFSNAVLALQGYLQEFKRNQDPPGVLILGPAGTGKTHLAVAVLRGIISRGTRGLFLDCGNLLEQVKSSFGSSGRAEILLAALETDVVVLDSMGEQSSSEWVRDTIASVITPRYNNRLPTIATTSLEEADLQKLGDRVASRLREMCRFVQIPLGAEDYRKNNPISRGRREA